MEPVDINNIDKMTSEEIKEALIKYGNDFSVEPVTTETRSVYEQKLRALLASETSEAVKCDLSSQVNKPQLVLQPRLVEADVYYGLFVPNEVESDTQDMKKVYTDKSKCLTVMKRFHGSRFKGFCTYNEALCFSEYGPIVSCVPTTPEKPTAPPVTGSAHWGESSPFRGPKSQALVAFRKSIELGKVQHFDECVESNPRFLVSSGDTPSILQEGARYNALHIACKHNKPQFCEKILNIVARPEFFLRLYPDDCMETAERRTRFLVDLYLNTPDKGCNETPLHFACKYGAVDCVKVLISYSICNRFALNKFSETPEQIICSRLRNNQEQVEKKIRPLFQEQYYVPVLRDEDNCLPPCVGTPWSPSQGNEPPIPPTISNGDTNKCSPISPMFKIKGYAGPMSPQQADTFYSRWRKCVAPSPSRNKRAKVAALRVTDHEKGLERVGRDLATEYKVEWAEYWDFLGGDFVNIVSVEGLAKLEEHLRSKYKEIIQQRSENESRLTLLEASRQSLKDSALDSSHSTCVKEEMAGNADTTQSSLSTIGDLCQNLEALRLNVSLSPNPEHAKGRPVLESTLHTPMPDTLTDGRNNNSFNSPEDQLNTTENYNFAVQSARITALRLVSVFSDISKTISAHIGPDFATARRLRNKMKPEVSSLRNVLSKCLRFADETLDLSFVHVFLAAKTAEILTENVTVSSLFLLSELVKMLAGNLDSFEESSSEDESEIAVREHDSDARERGEILTHFCCVARKLDNALQMSLQLAKDGRDEFEGVRLDALEECTCSWRILDPEALLSPSRKYPVDLKKLNDSFNNNKKTKSGGRFSRAHSFLHRVLFWKRTCEDNKEDKSEGKREVYRVFESSVKHLSFSEDPEEDEEKQQIGEDDKDDKESFASAVSSLEEDVSMATPEEEVHVYINGGEPSKDDLDVFIAMDGLSVNESLYQRVSEWIRLVESHSQQTRESWTTSACSRSKAGMPATSSPLYGCSDIKKTLFPKSPL